MTCLESHTRKQVLQLNVYQRVGSTNPKPSTGGRGALDLCLAAGIPESSILKWDMAETAKLVHSSFLLLLLDIISGLHGFQIKCC